MPQHKSLNLSRFLTAIPPDLLQRYFDRLAEGSRPGPWAALNPDHLEGFLDNSENAEASALIREDFQRANDIAQVGMGILVSAAETFGIPVAVDVSPEALALNLLTEHDEAFSFAWSHYLLYGRGGAVSVYGLPAIEVRPSDHEIETIKLAIRSWFSGQKKGEQCRVLHYEQHGELILLIQHGSYMRAVPFWRGNDLDISSFRPALEDVLVYERVTGILRVKAPGRDQRHYLHTFCAVLLRDESIADAAERDTVFSLAPIQEGRFDYGGDGVITSIDLVSARLKVAGAADTVVEIKASDVQRALRLDLGGLTLQSGVLLSVRLQFHIKEPGRRRTSLTFDVTPPARTDLAEKRYTDVVMRYLKREGVALK